MTNRVGDLCDISTGPNPLFPPSETATTSEADDRPEGREDDEEEEEEEPISEVSSDEDDDDVEEIEEPVPLQVESVAHRLVNKFENVFNIPGFSFSIIVIVWRCGKEESIPEEREKEREG